jgi:MFS family permease
VNRDSLARHQGFRRLWAGDALSQFGRMVTTLAMPLLAVTVLHATAFQVGLLTTFEFLAFLLIGLPAGAWVDRLRRRGVMIVADLGRAAALGSVPLAAVLGVLTIWQLYAVVLLTGALTVFFDVSYQSYLPFLVGRDRLVEGNAKLQGTQSVAQVAGPGVGGLLVQALTAPFALLADVASYLWSALWLGAIRRREPAPEPVAHTPLRTQIREGVAFVVKHPLLRPIAGCTATSNLWSSARHALLVLFLARDVGLSAGIIGVLMSAGACGGIVGALVARRLAERVGRGRLIWLSMAVGSPFTLVIPFVHRDWTLGLFVLAWIVVSAKVVIYNVTQVSLRQTVCPERLLGRVNATMRFFVWGIMPLGVLLGGALGTVLGVREALLVVALGSLLPFLWPFFSPLRRMRELPAEYAEPAVPAA